MVKPQSDESKIWCFYILLRLRSNNRNRNISVFNLFRLSSWNTQRVRNQGRGQMTHIYYENLKMLQNFWKVEGNWSLNLNFPLCWSWNWDSVRVEGLSRGAMSLTGRATMSAQMPASALVYRELQNAKANTPIA